jgi:arabinan endo-1,5-alpha-L-arabinosidase
LVPMSSDEFNGSLAPGWTLTDRNDEPDPSVEGGEFVWPVEATDLNGPGSNSDLLLREPPSQTGTWAIETKLTINLGENDLLNFQQGGLVTYVNDDLFTRLSHVAIWNTRQTEFGKEMPYAGRVQNGGTIVGPPAATTYLRIVHRTDPANGEHELRAWTKREGGVWVKGGVWTLPADSHIRVGLISHGWQPGSCCGGDRRTSRFDYFHTYTG